MEGLYSEGNERKEPLVQIHHIKAHEGVENLFQRGNDMADKMAKESLTRAEEMKAIPYFTSYEEEIVLFHEGTLIEGTLEHGSRSTKSIKLSRTGRHSKCPAS